MKLKLKNNLINSLIKSDFLFLKNYRDWNSIHLLKINQLKTKTISFLNPITLLKNLKQYVRLIQFYKKQNIVSACLNFFVNSLYQKKIIEKFFSINKLKLKFKILYKYLLLKKNQVYIFKHSVTKFQSLFCFDKTISKSVTNLNKILSNQLFLIQEIHTLSIIKNIGSYHITNSLYDYKKLIFILIFFNQVLRKKIKLKKKN